VVFTDDPIESGLATSMLRPGENTTGARILARQLDGKRLEILHELVAAARDASAFSSIRRKWDGRRSKPSAAI
jgi:hypothetical protein